MTLVFLNHETVFHCHVKRRSEWVYNMHAYPSTLSLTLCLKSVRNFPAIHASTLCFCLWLRCGFFGLLFLLLYWNLTTYLRRAKQSKAYLERIHISAMQSFRKGLYTCICAYVRVRISTLIDAPVKEMKDEGDERVEGNVARVFINLGTIGSTLVWLWVHTFIDFLIICTRIMPHG